MIEIIQELAETALEVVVIVLYAILIIGLWAYSQGIIQ